jgi:hypothetical protein
MDLTLKESQVNKALDELAKLQGLLTTAMNVDHTEDHPMVRALPPSSFFTMLTYGRVKLDHHRRTFASQPF